MNSATTYPQRTNSGDLPSAQHHAGRPVLRYLAPLAAAGLTILASACGYATHHASAAAHPRAHRGIAVTAASKSKPVTARTARAAGVPAARYTGPHFRTPQAAMRYLAAAYNSHNNKALHHVTNPDAFAELRGMRSEAVNLHLVSCTRNKGGDYTCKFRHDYPPSLHKTGHGASTFTVAPALNPGWYMYYLLQCG